AAQRAGVANPVVGTLAVTAVVAGLEVLLECRGVAGRRAVRLLAAAECPLLSREARYGVLFAWSTQRDGAGWRGRRRLPLHRVRVAEAVVVDGAVLDRAARFIRALEWQRIVELVLDGVVVDGRADQRCSRVVWLAALHPRAGWVGRRPDPEE